MTKIDQIIVRMGFDDEIALVSPKSVTAKSAPLVRAAIQRATLVIETVGGQMTLAEALVRAAVEARVPRHCCSRRHMQTRLLSRHMNLFCPCFFRAPR